MVCTDTFHSLNVALPVTKANDNPVKYCFEVGWHGEMYFRIVDTRITVDQSKNKV